MSTEGIDHIVVESGSAAHGNRCCVDISYRMVGTHRTGPDSDQMSSVDLHFVCLRSTHGMPPMPPHGQPLQWQHQRFKR